MDSNPADHRESCMHAKVALVTGGAQGIGRSIAERFQSAGARVCIIDCDREASETAILEMTQGNPNLPVSFIAANLENADEIDSAVATFTRTYGRIDVLINNAGIELDLPFAEVTVAGWDKLQAINLRAPFLLTQSLLPLFPASGGAVINISSIHSTHAFPNAAAYACSKAGLLALTRNLALELSTRHIRVNAICPGYIDTRLWDHYLSQAPNAEELAAQTTALHPVGRRGTAWDVAQAALFLAGETSSFITGTQIVVDGGLTIRAHP